jgi:DNA processing protein
LPRPGPGEPGLAAPLVLDPRDPAAAAAVADWLALQRALALAPQAAVDALRASGWDPRAALARRPRATACVAAAPPQRAPALLARAGAVLVPYVSPVYPWRLARIADPAPVLSVIGDVTALSAPAVALVGSRAASSYGRRVTRNLSADLARAGLVIVSGLAHGIDAEAHRAALDAGGRTVAVQACGPDRVYPAAHRRLARDIAQAGAVVTELPPGAAPLRAHFPLRNRLISGLSRALVVVEARERSGSLITVGHALHQGIDVFAVPGPVDAPTSAVPNRLLRDGALPALDASDVLDALALAAEPAARPRSEPEAPSPAAAALLAVLARGPASRDELARAVRQPPGAIAGAVLDLELEGRIARDRDGRLRIVA